MIYGIRSDIKIEQGKVLKFSLEHGRSVGDMAYALSKALHLKERDCTFNKIAGYYHDIGKCKIPYSIVFKAGKLCEYEFEVMKKHVQHSYSILSKKGFDKSIVTAILDHHENYCGNVGYPRGIKGEIISLGGRILAVCDVFDAFTNTEAPRPYRIPLPPDEALREMGKEENKHKFDPKILQAFKYLVKSDKIKGVY